MYEITAVDDVNSAEYCGTDGEVTALCAAAVRKEARKRRVPPERVLMDTMMEEVNYDCC